MTAHENSRPLPPRFFTSYSGGGTTGVAPATLQRDGDGDGVAPAILQRNGDEDGGPNGAELLYNRG